MVGELRNLKNKLEMYDDVISDGFKKAEAKKEERDEKRKLLVLAEVKSILKTLHSMDTEMLKEIKYEVCDRREEIRQLKVEVLNLLESAKIPGQRVGKGENIISASGEIDMAGGNIILAGGKIILAGGIFLKWHKMNGWKSDFPSEQSAEFVEREKFSSPGLLNDQLVTTRQSQIGPPTEGWPGLGLVQVGWGT